MTTDLSNAHVLKKMTIHKVVTVSAAQYNSMLRYLNKHLSQTEVD